LSKTPRLRLRNIYVGALCGLAVFFVAYRGYDRSDSVITNVAGVATIALALCPTTAPCSPDLRQVIIGDLRASSQTPRWEVITYRVCGFTIGACVALIYPGSLVYSYCLLIPETILMTASGLSWFIKGGKLLVGG
jgi:hypothetical protein